MIETGAPAALVRIGHTLTYGQAKHAARTGVLPDGTLVEPELFGLVGRLVVVSLDTNQAALDFLICSQRVRG